MMRFIILAVVILSTAWTVKAQTNNKQTAAKSTGIVVNREMINRFNSVQTEGGIYSWSQLIENFESRNISELLAIYRVSDLNNVSLQQLMLALKEKTGSQKEDLSESEAYCAYINQVKQEIATKLASGIPMAMK